MSSVESPFVFVNEILSGKNDIIKDEATEKAYSPFLTNRSLSYHLDTILFANEMNQRSHLDSKLQFHFLLNIVRAKKRRHTKWVKSDKSEDLQCIKTYFGYSDAKAREAMRLLSEEQIQQIKQKTETGGLRK